MSDWKPIVVGVDRSPESAWAAVMGWRIAQSAGTTCHLVHGTHEVTAIPISQLLRVDAGRLGQQLTARARRRLDEALQGSVPPQALDTLDVRLGRGVWALAHAVREHDAELLIVGGKHHSPPARWLGGSTAQHAVRFIDVPVLVTWAPRQAIRRILVAVDSSYAATPALHTGARYAELFAAELWAVHVVEPLPLIEELPIHMDDTAHERHAAERFEETVVAALGDTHVERLVRHGSPASEIAEVSAATNADLVVVGSHGKGWVDRVLSGSTTERLINRLPTSLLVVPVHPAPGESTVLRLAGAAPRARAGQPRTTAQPAVP
jgi:nucleotide-binding universal stress UspA family protein